jgi:p-hydroxybenzoate 3-monooxygenase
VRTQVVIIGAGPAGLTLALLLQAEGIESVILEARNREYVEGRVRAGLLEHNTVALLRDLGAADRLEREGLVHEGIYLRREGASRHIPLTELTGRHVTVYGQQEVVKDLIATWLARGGQLHFEVSDVRLHDLAGERPSVTYRSADPGADEQRIDCDVIAGCDGFHGIGRQAVPGRIELEHVYPFAWLGILAHAAPATDELIYASHPDGFALYSMRSPQVSRLYLQVDPAETLEAWSDDRIWSELNRRLAGEDHHVTQVSEGPIFDRSITPMRSFICEEMQYGRLLLAGDAAHIVPPTGAKGLNLAINDVRLLAQALAGFYRDGADETHLERYPAAALARVWRAQEFSNYMTQLLHRTDEGAFGHGLQRSRLDYVFRSDAAARSLAENYVGLPAGPDY